MARNLLDLAKDMEKVNAKVSQAASDHAVKIATTIVGDLVYHTPVDTSQALSNWDVTLGTRADFKHGPHFPGQAGSTQRQSAAETLRLAKQVLQNKKPGQSIFITNNQPYIRRLNDGTHSQQPGGFLERALLLGRKIKAQFKLGK